jgi:class 3 adenylate cyclase
MNAPETQYVTVGDAQIAYQVIGDGPIDLVYHHGFCHLDLQWDVVSEAAWNRGLASFSRLIMFDRRGSGASERIPLGEFPTWEVWNADLLAVLDAVGSPSAALFAELEAGPMAIMFAAAHPERVTALVLGNTYARNAGAPDYPIGLSAPVVDELSEFLESMWGKTEGLQAFMPSLANSPAELASLARLARAAATPRIAGSQFRYINGQLDAREALPLLSMPTLVVHNRAALGLDPVTQQAARAQYLAEHIPGARYLEVPGDDAFFFAGDHAVVLDAVAEFLTGQRGPVATDRFLTTVMFTDIVGSTEHAVSRGDQRWRELLDAHDRSVRDLLRRYAGREIKTTGDGFLACFDGPARAIDCAAEITHFAHMLGIEVRAGLHTGECERRGDDIAGFAVHVAARVGALAGPGEVLVSRTVTDLVAGAGLTFTDRGEHPLKGIPDTWHLFAANPR